MIRARVAFRKQLPMWAVACVLVTGAWQVRQSVKSLFEVDNCSSLRRVGGGEDSVGHSRHAGAPIVAVFVGPIFVGYVGQIVVLGCG